MAAGRTATILTDKPNPEGAVALRITTKGKEAQTNAQRLKERIILRYLEGSIDFKQNIAFNALWSPPEELVEEFNVPLPPEVTVKLNESQRNAVSAVICNPHPGTANVQLIVGPPGTGKTTTISACVQAFRAAQEPVWLLAQSNVAVKNIAEKLAKIGFFQFRLLVSQEFHFGWRVLPTECARC